jgi:1-acyl-sn-glycerol-3-phosphate acyltransferase
VKRLAYAWAKLTGWTFVGMLPEDPKFIVIGAHHTSNWDFVIFLAALRHFDIHAKFLGKHTLFRWPFGRFFERLGGIPVDRSTAGGIVTQVARAFEAADEMVLVLAPEGTRKTGRWWKSGFLKIAEATNVPVVPAAIDYPTKTVTLGDALSFDGDVSEFMDRVRAFYADKRGRYPKKETPVAVRQEPKRS